jgi:hypothetical protein
LLSAGRTLEEAEREAARSEGRGAKAATPTNASSNANNNTRKVNLRGKDAAGNRPATRPISAESDKLKGANR